MQKCYFYAGTLQICQGFKTNGNTTWNSHQTKVLSGFEPRQDSHILIQVPAALDFETSDLI